MGKEMIDAGDIRGLPKRKLTEETCKKFGYSVSRWKGKLVQVAPYYDNDGKLAAQKLRFSDKGFVFLGEPKTATLFGQNLWKSGGKKVTITEGEIDAMSLSQAQGNKWPVVSVQNGAKGAVNSIRYQLEWVSSFEEVVLMFDQDEPGREAAQEVATLLKPGQAKIASLPLKDPNEMLVAGKTQELISSMWQAKEYRPDGIVDIDEILDLIEKPIEWGLPWCIDTLTNLTYGRREGEVYTIGAGTGSGKTDFLTQQIAYDVNDLGVKVGVIYLEAKPAETGKRIAGKVDGVRYHIPDGEWDKDQLRKTLNKMKGNVIFYDSWGETDWEIVKAKIRFMAVGKQVKHFYLDHLTAMADTSNEKESLEQLMKELAGLAQELQIVVHLISHLSTPEGKPHEEGGRVMIRHFKGSRSIGFWSHYMFGMERDQQAADSDESHTTTFRVLKDRYTGQATGKTIELIYDHLTGRMIEVAGEPSDYGFSEGSGSAEDHGF
jgi:twinkle protein